MTSTVNDIVTKFRHRFYPNCDAATCESLFGDAWKWAVVRFRLRETSVTVPLEEGVREYDLPSGVGAIREAYYQPAADASSWHVLKGVSIDQLARLNEGWRANDEESTPSRYYLRFSSDTDSGKRVIGFEPIPDRSTESGYPNITLFTVEGSDLTGSEAVPAFLLTDDWFLYYMAEKWAVAQDPQRAGYWVQFRQDEEAKTASYLKSGADDVPSLLFISPFANRTSRVV
jgi:hypothetical protein